MENVKDNLPEISKQEYESLQNAGGGFLCERIANIILDSVGGILDADTMSRLNGSQITLIAYTILRGELLEGGFIQLIHNGYGAFIFENPFAKAMRLWGSKELCNKIYDARKLYEKYKDQITKDCSEEEFMALYEQYEDFDEYDDDFVEAEPGYTEVIASYVVNHIDEFVRII